MLELLSDLYSDLSVAVSCSKESQFSKKSGFLLACQAFSIFMVGREPVFQVIEGECETFR